MYNLCTPTAHSEMDFIVRTIVSDKSTGDLATKLCHLVLTYNYFKFSNNLYIQVNGIPKGIWTNSTRCPDNFQPTINLTKCLCKKCTFWSHLYKYMTMHRHHQKTDKHIKLPCKTYQRTYCPVLLTEILT